MHPARRSKCTRREFPGRALPTKRARKPRTSSLAAFDTQRSPPKVSNRSVGCRKARSRSPARTLTVKQSPLPVFDPTTAFNNEGIAQPKTVRPVPLFNSELPSYAPPPHPLRHLRPQDRIRTVLQPSSPIQTTNDDDAIRRFREFLLRRELSPACRQAIEKPIKTTQRNVIHTGMVYEMEVISIKVRRRFKDGRVDINQLVRATGDINQSERRILKSRITTVGGIYTGTWVEVKKAWKVCKTRGVAELFQPLFQYDLD